MTDKDNNENVEEAVAELRKRFEGDMDSELFEDVYLFRRFLTAQGFNVNNAEAMLRKHLEWRKEKDIKNIFHYTPPEVFLEYIPYVFLGYSKEGFTVRYCPMGNCDVIGINCCFKYEEQERYFLHQMETDIMNLKKRSKELGRNVDKGIYIYNLENLSLAKATDKKGVYNLISIITLYQDNYPDMLEAIYVINASFYFTIIYNVLKKFAAKSIIQKFHIYSDESWKEDILKVIDADVLPAFLGGNRTDPDGNPLCLSFINPGGRIPDTYYKHKSKRSLLNQDGVKKITLTQSAFHEEFLDVREPESCIEWEFETKSRDIGFGLFYENSSDGSDSNMTELVPLQRIDTEEYSESGTYMCKIAGKYIVLFDNTYSWIRSKEIYYRIKIVTPEEMQSAINN